MTIAEQLDLVEQQIHTLNEAQALYPAKNEHIKIYLSNKNSTKEYDSTDTFLDLYLDACILHQSLFSNYKFEVRQNNKKVLTFNITKGGYENIKKALDSQK